jgi:hypothetical protein
MTGIPMALAALLATAGEEPAKKTEPPQPVVRWQTIQLTEKSPQAAKRSAIAARGIQARPAPEANPLVARVQPDGSIVIGHFRPAIERPSTGEPE